MQIEPHDKLDDALVRGHVCDVTDKDAAWVFLQEPGFIGFGVAHKEKNEIIWPPNARQPIDWKRVSDLRLFGEKGEWHAWQHWDQDCPWQSRLLKLDEVCDSLTEYHALWGNDVNSRGEYPWIQLVEERGVEIWLPLEDEELEKTDLPLRLEIRQIVGYDDATEDSSHLAGIVDAAVIELVDRSCTKITCPEQLSDSPS